MPTRWQPLLKALAWKKAIRFWLTPRRISSFPILPDSVIEKLRESYSFEGWGRIDESHSAVRFCTSWAN